MTTGNDYINDFISMDEPDGTRSVAKLEKEAAENGYTNMSDKEIEKLMQYRERMATQSAMVQDNLQQQQLRSELLKNHLDQQQQHTLTILNELVGSPLQFEFVDGSEVE